MTYDLEANRRVNGEFGNKTQTEAEDGVIKPRSVLDGVSLAAIAARRDDAVRAAREANRDLHLTAAASIAVTVLREFPNARYVHLDQGHGFGDLAPRKILDGDRNPIPIDNMHVIRHELSDWTDELPQGIPYENHLADDGAVEQRNVPGYEWFIREKRPGKLPAYLIDLEQAVAFARTVADRELGPDETAVDYSRPSHPREVHRDHIAADRDHKAVAGTIDAQFCGICGLSMTSDGRHGYDA